MIRRVAAPSTLANVMIDVGFPVEVDDGLLPDTVVHRRLLEEAQRRAKDDEARAAFRPPQSVKLDLSIVTVQELDAALGLSGEYQSNGLALMGKIHSGLSSFEVHRDDRFPEMERVVNHARQRRDRIVEHLQELLEFHENHKAVSGELEVDKTLDTEQEEESP